MKADKTKTDEEKNEEQGKQEPRLSFQFRGWRDIKFDAIGDYAIAGGLTGLAMILVVIAARFH